MISIKNSIDLYTFKIFLRNLCFLWETSHGTTHIYSSCLDLFAHGAKKKEKENYVCTRAEAKE